MTLPGLRALRHPDYRIYLTAQAIALVGMWMQQVTVQWLVLALTDSPFRLGLIGTLNFAPALFLAVVAGAVADRFPRGRLLLFTQSVLALQALTLATLVMTGLVRYWHLCVLALVWGLLTTLDLPVRQSLVMDLVGRDDVVSAVSLNSACFNAARILGPAVAGVLIARVGLAPAFLLNGLGLLLVVALLARIARRGGGGRPRTTTMMQEIAEGLRYARRTPGIVLALALLLAVSLTVFNFGVYVPLFARNVLGRGAEVFGLLMATLGVGSVAGALAVGVRARSPSSGTLFAASAVAAAGLLGLAAARDLPLAALALFVVGLASIVMVTGASSALQLQAPDELRGRVMSLHTLVFGGAFPIGAFLTGTVAEHWGVTTALVVNGGVGLAATGAIVVWWRMRARGMVRRAP
jgi:predicted MFS family arabinose efflux permease